MTKPITHVATSDITDMMHPGPERRMDLPGFDPEFVDFPHYIIRITERIWHDREVELCLKWYSETCAIHTMSGDISGAQTVVDNTYATLNAFPDRRLDADNVIWSDEGSGVFYSSHLITSKMTNEGASEFGPPTNKKVRVQTIAECLCQNNQVIEEWLVRDNLAVVQQLGFDADAIASSQARHDLEQGKNLVEWHTHNRARTQSPSGDISAKVGTASDIAITALRATLQERDIKAISALYNYRARASYPGGEHLYGPDQVIDWLTPFWHAFSDVCLSVDHIAEIPYLGNARDVSLRWSLTASHSRNGRYGEPTGTPIYILGVTHYRIMNGRIVEDVCIWDDLALRRQIETIRQTT